MRFSPAFLLVLLVAPMCSAQDTNFASGPNYLITTADTRFLHPIATPSMSLDAPLPAIPSLPETGGGIADQPYISNLDTEHQPNLFPVYYGYPEIPVIELAGTPDIEPPPSMHDTGFAVTDSASLREVGNGMTVGEAAAFWKTHKRTAPRVYTNADIQRLHRS
jgi:hypothetical protein